MQLLAKQKQHNNLCKRLDQMGMSNIREWTNAFCHNNMETQGRYSDNCYLGMSGMKIILLVQTINFEGVEIIRFPDVE